MDMSKAIREGRDRLGMSQEALAERLGVSRQAVSKWEMGTSVPSPENRRALSEILGTDLQVERETAPPVPLRRWKRLTLAAGLLCLALLAALGWILYSAHQDGWPPPEDPQITGVYFYDAAGQEIAKKRLRLVSVSARQHRERGGHLSGRPGAHGGSGGFVSVSHRHRVAEGGSRSASGGSGWPDLRPVPLADPRQPLFSFGSAAGVRGWSNNLRLSVERDRPGFCLLNECPASCKISQIFFLFLTECGAFIRSAEGVE